MTTIIVGGACLPMAFKEILPIWPVMAMAVASWILLDLQLKALKQSTLEAVAAEPARAANPATVGLVTLSPRGQKAVTLLLHIMHTFVLSLLLVFIAHFMSGCLLAAAHAVRFQGLFAQAGGLTQLSGLELKDAWFMGTFWLVFGCWVRHYSTCLCEVDFAWLDWYLGKPTKQEVSSSHWLSSRLMQLVRWLAIFASRFSPGARDSTSSVGDSGQIWLGLAGLGVSRRASAGAASVLLLFCGEALS